MSLNYVRMFNVGLVYNNPIRIGNNMLMSLSILMRIF
jgi:hypothetical protein